MSIPLELDVTADAANAVASLGSVGDAAKGMADDVQAAASTADTAAGSMDGLAAGADAVDSKMGAATGSLGALAGGLEAAGFEGAAAGLQGVAAATDFASGAGGILNLVMDTQAAKFIVAKAQAAGHIIALGALKVATGASAAAQWLLNAAMSASPLGIAVVVVGLLVAAFILAYQKSETFRDIVSTAMDVVKGAIDKVKEAVGFVIEAVQKMDGPWAAVQTAIDNALTPAKVIIDGVKSAVDAVIGAVQSLIDWISKIDFPSFDIPGIPRFGGLSTEGTDPNDPRLTANAAPVFLQFPITVQGDTDPDAAAERIIQKLQRYLERQGKTLVIT